MTLDLSQVTWNPDTNQWIDNETGLPVPEDRVLGEVFSHADAAQENLTDLTNALYEGDITLEEWETATALELQDAYIAEAAFAVGGIDNVDAAVLAGIAVLLANQLGFLNGFANDIASGTVSQAQAVSRINQYGNAAVQAYWDEWQGIRENPNFEGLHGLTRVPQDGSTICRGNCRCFLEESSEGILWQLTAVESCDTCLDMNAGNPWAPML